MASGGKSASQKNRAERERARLYEDRARVHEAKITRRRRDNIIAGVVGGLIVVGAIAAQAVYFTAGPGVPEPTPTTTSTPDATTTPTPSVTVTPSEAPAPTATPTP